MRHRVPEAARKDWESDYAYWRDKTHERSHQYGEGPMMTYSDYVSIRRAIADWAW